MSWYKNEDSQMVLLILFVLMSMAALVFTFFMMFNYARHREFIECVEVTKDPDGCAKYVGK